LIGIVGWQIGSFELANIELRDDMRDLAAQVGWRAGLNPPNTDEDFRRAVARRAEGYGIQLEPEQVKVQRSGTDVAPIIYLSADYEARVKLLVFSFALHFNASSAK